MEGVYIVPIERSCERCEMHKCVCEHRVVNPDNNKTMKLGEAIDSGFIRVLGPGKYEFVRPIKHINIIATWG